MSVDNGCLNCVMAQEFQKEKVEPLRKTCDDTRRVGQALIQSAAPGVSTTDIEFNLQTLNTAWTTLNDRVRQLFSDISVIFRYFTSQNNPLLFLIYFMWNNYISLTSYVMFSSLRVPSSCIT